MNEISKYISYLRDIADEIEKSGMPGMYRPTAFQLAATPMHYWAESEEKKTIYDVLGIYKDCITLDGDNVVTLGYIGDKFPVIARELESLGYRYSRENRRFMPLVKKISEEDQVK